MRALVRLLPIVLALFLSACGKDPPRHGLSTKPLESNPSGDAIEVRYELEDRAAYVATVKLSTGFVKREPNDDGPNETRGSGSAVLEVEQVFAHADPERPPTSAIRLRYVEAKGLNAEAYLARKTLVGALNHEASGRPRPETLRIDGGEPGERTEALDLLGGLIFAGYAGSPPWLPPRPVRVGEAWQLESFTRPRALDNVLRQARKVGMAVPEPTFSGTARLERVTEEDGETLLEVSLDALLEIQGDFRMEGMSGQMSVGDRVRGRAVISARTGLPVSFRVTHTGSKRMETGGTRVEQEFTSEVDGRVERLKRR